MRIVVLALAMCGCLRTEPAASARIAGITTKPDTLREPMRAVRIDAVVEALGDLELFGADCSIERVGPARAVELTDNPETLPGGTVAEIGFRGFFDTPLVVGETVTVEVRLVLHGSGGLFTLGARQTWTVEGPPDGTDTDGDGIPDNDELAIGTSPLSSDTDGDAIDDLTELGADPAVPVDSDGDGTIDALDADSDNGGEPDRTEFLGGRDPTSPADDLVGAALVVTTLDDELDGGAGLADVASAGGAADLSLREAIVLANNRGGADAITFDPAVFDGQASLIFGETLGAFPSLTDPGTSIDGSGADVVLRPADGTALWAYLRVSANDCRVAHLTIVGLDCQCSGNGPGVYCGSAERLVIDSVTFRTACSGGCGASTGVSADHCGELTVADIETDTLDGMWLGDCVGCRVLGGAFDVSYLGIHLANATSTVVDGVELVGGGTGLYFVDGANLTVARSVFRGQAHEAISIDLGGAATIVDNQFGPGGERAVQDEFAGPIALRRNTADGFAFAPYSLSSPPEVPILTTFDGARVTGSAANAEDGAIVEIFADDDGEAAAFVGEGVVSGGAFAIDVTLPPALASGTLTATVTVDSGTRSSPLSAPLAY